MLLQRGPYYSTSTPITSRRLKRTRTTWYDTRAPPVRSLPCLPTLSNQGILQHRVLEGQWDLLGFDGHGPDGPALQDGQAGSVGVREVVPARFGRILPYPGARSTHSLHSQRHTGFVTPPPPMSYYYAHSY